MSEGYWSNTFCSRCAELAATQTGPVSCPADCKLQTQYEYLSRHANSHRGFFPDEMIDNEHMRERNCDHIHDDLKKLAICYSQGLIIGVVFLPDLDSRRLKCKATIEAAVEMVNILLENMDMYETLWKLERGREGRTHVHVVLPGDVDITGLDYWDFVNLTKLRKLARYLAKPADARLCRPRLKERKIWRAKGGLKELNRMRLEGGEQSLRQRGKSKERLHFLRSRGLRKIKLPKQPEE